MTLYLGFLRNTVTGEEFVAPADALNPNHARQQFDGAYPEPVYALLTIYARQDLLDALATVERMPGLPSKPQPALAALLAQIQAKQVDGAHVVHDELEPQETPLHDQAAAGRISRHASEAMDPPSPLIEKPRSLIEALRGLRG